jgi:23S rRNA (guanosine2251-2'-O)-methyltransferase
MKPPSPDYTQRKTRFERCLTVYGRKPVLEALQAPGVGCERLHLARSNRQSEILDEIVALAGRHGAEIREHDRSALAHISRNAREDQGVAADLRWDGYQQLDDVLSQEHRTQNSLLAVDGLTNPQNLGMLLRSAAAAGIGVVLPREGNCDISPLVIKASAGAIFRANILRCGTLGPALGRLQERGWKVAVLEADAGQSLFSPLPLSPRVFVLGGETSGASQDVLSIADERLFIPMQNGVESLNVAVTGALVAYRASLTYERA